MKKIASFIALAVIAYSGGPAIGFAQTATTTLASFQAQLDLISQLTKQIQALQEQINQIQQQKQQSVTQLIASLREGSQGDEVKILQALLAADSEIYPEGLITGFFGRLTAAAVKKFQAKNKLDQVGRVGPKTLEKLNQMLMQTPVLFEEHATGTKQLCVAIPPGHLIAPGWLRKQGGVQPIVSVCQTLPPGIQRLLGYTSSTLPVVDTTPPVISSIAVSNIASSTATVGWITNEAATSKVYYATNSLVVLTAASSTGNTTLIATHSLGLTGLNASSTYYFVVESKDASNNTATSSQQMFVTLP